jgi:cytochrome c oxidase subunit II
VPEFLYKHDAIPGRTARFDITPEQTGTFDGACAEFCGLNHAFMRFSVRVVPADEFERWVTEAATSATPVASASPSTSIPLETGPTGSTAEASAR